MTRILRQLVSTTKQALIPRRPSQKHLVWAIRIFVALTVVVGILILLVRFGLVTSENATLIGALIALTGVVITQVVNTRIAQSNQRQQQKLEISRAQAQQELETGRAQAARFQAYLEQMEKLLLDHQLRSAVKTSNLPRVAGGVDLSKLTEDSDDARVVAQAQTLAVLEGEQDAHRKRILLLFLYDSALINKNRSVISLLRANLSSADLSSADLGGAGLSGAYLRKAYLTMASLTEANVTAADLRGAKLSGADLSGAYLIRANLLGAKVAQEQLAMCGSLEGTTLPDGSKHD